MKKIASFKLNNGETTMVKHSENSLEIYVGTEQCSADIRQESQDDSGAEGGGQDTAICGAEHCCGNILSCTTARNERRGPENGVEKPEEV